MTVEEPEARNRKAGFFLFAVYAMAYATFVIVNAFAPDFMERECWGGINLAVTSGLGLILLGLLLALMYGWLCRERGAQRGGVAADGPIETGSEAG